MPETKDTSRKTQVYLFFSGKSRMHQVPWLKLDAQAQAHMGATRSSDPILVEAIFLNRSLRNAEAQPG